METVRSFIAIELGPEVKESLKSMQTWLKGKVGLPVKWVDPNGIHLTLKFLGDVEMKKLDQVKDAMAAAVDGVGPFWIELDKPGVFPSEARPRGIWVGVGGEMEPLRKLQGEIDRVLKPLGFVPEKRDFTPHLTLGRVREGVGYGGEDLRMMFGSMAVEKARQQVEGISLMKSDLRPSGAVYTRMAEARLS